MKMLNSSARIKCELVENAEEESVKQYSAVMAHIGVMNDNGYLLDGDVVEFERERYPLLYQHNMDDPNALIGYVEPRFIAESGQYVALLVFNENGKSIQSAIDSGVYDSVSISYYVDELEWDEGWNMIVKAARMAELSIVTVGADKDAKLFGNGLSEDLKKEREAAKNSSDDAQKLKGIKEKYEFN